MKIGGRVEGREAEDERGEFARGNEVEGKEGERRRGQGK